MKTPFLLSLLLIVGCGTSVPNIGPQGPAGEQGLQGEPGPQGEPGDSSLLAWGIFPGLSPGDFIADGQIPVVEFVKESEGVYRVVFDIETEAIGVVYVFASAHGSEPNGTNITLQVSASQDVSAHLLTVNVISTISIVDSAGVFLQDFDALFTLAIIGTMPD